MNDQLSPLDIETAQREAWEAVGGEGSYDYLEVVCQDPSHARGRKAVVGVIARQRTGSAMLRTPARGATVPGVAVGAWYTPLDRPIRLLPGRPFAVRRRDLAPHLAHHGGAQVVAKAGDGVIQEIEVETSTLRDPTSAGEYREKWALKCKLCGREFKRSNPEAAMKPIVNQLLRFGASEVPLAWLDANVR